MGVDFQRPEFFALGAEALPHWLHAWRGRSVPVKPRVCHAWGERRERVRAGWFSPIAVNVCWGVGEWLGEYLGLLCRVCNRRLAGRISALAWGSRCWALGGDGWGALSGFGELLRPVRCWGDFFYSVRKKIEHIWREGWWGRSAMGWLWEKSS